MQARQTIQAKYPETDIKIQTLSDRDNPDNFDGPASLIFVSSNSFLSVEVAKMIICRIFKDQMGIVLEEFSPKFFELQQRYERSKESLKNFENENVNLKEYCEKLQENKSIWKDKAKKLDESIIAREKEMVKLRVNLKKSRDAHGKVVKERETMLKQIGDLKDKAKRCEEYEEVPESIKIEMKDENIPTTCRCPQLIVENKELKESLLISEGLVELREQELRLVKKPQKNVVDIFDVNDEA